MITRRGLLGGILGAMSAPAIVKVANIMAIKPTPIWTGYFVYEIVQVPIKLWQSGIDNDEVDAMGYSVHGDNQALFNLIKSRIDHAEKQFRRYAVEYLNFRV